MIVWILALGFLLLIAAAVALLRRAGGGSFPWLQFYAKGKESGFTFREVNMLRKVAVENRLKYPTSLFWSIGQLDRSIKGMINKFRSQGIVNDAGPAEFLSKLFDFRKNVEFDLPKYKLGLRTTRRLPQRQRITINVPGVGTYNSQVVENLRRYMAISYPEGPKPPRDFTWRGQRVNVYFWRQDDAGYVFESKVLDDFLDRQYPILHLTHSDALVRSQKRRSVRITTNIPARLYPLRNISEAGESRETTRGLRCRIRDLSEDGAALLIGGRAKTGMAVKFQFSLGKSVVVMSGTVKGINYNERRNQSMLHIQAQPPSLPVKNRILTYVYNLFGEQDRDTRNSRLRRKSTAAQR
jgi:c-di-GMP-binding flagellar brake protein YcgR